MFKFDNIKFHDIFHFFQLLDDFDLREEDLPTTPSLPPKDDGTPGRCIYYTIRSYPLDTLSGGVSTAGVQKRRSTEELGPSKKGRSTDEPGPRPGPSKKGRSSK